MREEGYFKETKSIVKNGGDLAGGLFYFPILTSVGIAFCDRGATGSADSSGGATFVSCVSHSHEYGSRICIDRTSDSRGGPLCLVRTNGSRTIDPIGAAAAAAVGKFSAMALGWLWEDGAYA